MEAIVEKELGEEDGGGEGIEGGKEGEGREGKLSGGQ